MLQFLENNEMLHFYVECLLCLPYKSTGFKEYWEKGKRVSSETLMYTNIDANEYDCDVLYMYTCGS